MMRKPIDLHVAADGVEAMTFLRREDIYHNALRPDFILLDLNLPKIAGQVLFEIKNDPALKSLCATAPRATRRLIQPTVRR